MKQISVVIILTIACICSWQTKAQSFHNDNALHIAEENLPGVISENLTEAALPYTPNTELENCLKSKQRTKVVLGFTKQNRPVEVYYFPGLGNERALIIGGMHGSELSSVELAQNIVQQLSNGTRNYYDVLVIPVLFPDNAVTAQLHSGAKKIVNAGRYTTDRSVDPNRQMPAPGKKFDEREPFDFCGRMIETENQYLLQLIQDYKPSRIINLHAIRDLSKAGFYADPRTDCKGEAIGFETDSLLAVSMAKNICDNGGWVPGNHLQTSPTALYYNDPAIAIAGSQQQRNLHGSILPQNRGHGVSLGGWATTAVCNEKDSIIREAIRLITVEFPGYSPSSAYPDRNQRQQCLLNIQLYAAAIITFFLSNNDESLKQIL